MKFSWTGIKISIAGARLSHLALKDKIWDYGSMVAQVKTVFMQIEKAKKKDNADLLRNYTTNSGYQFLKKHVLTRDQKIHERLLENIAIIQVKVRSKQSPDRFCAWVKGLKNSVEKPFNVVNTNNTLKVFAEVWHFSRQGHWWKLDKIN